MAVIGRWERDSDGGPGVPGATAMSRGPEHRVAAFTLAALLVVGALMGTINLFVNDVLRDGPQRWIYGATMAACMLAAIPLLVRQRVGRRHTFGLVLLGDLIYLVVVFCIDDPVRYATPLMLLFPSFVAAWFLGRWELAVNMVVTTVVCLIALWPSYDDAVGLGVQVGVSAGMLNAGALGVFVLRRRVQRLLVATQTLSHLDPLTGLFNRRFLVAQAPRMWRQARRDGTRVAAMMLDLDHFKRLNDAHGHAAGDAVLRAVAASLGATVRPTDVLARIGGEEIVVLGLVGDPDQAARLAERLRSAVANSRTPDGHAVTASIGIALTRPVDGEDAADGLWRLVDRADAAMYEAKQQGRDRVASLWVPRARAPLPQESTTRQGPAATDVA
jgi:diguanylate cyclase (GGDEF)-like protein